MSSNDGSCGWSTTPVVARGGHVLLALVLPYLRLRYRRMARTVARDIEDYLHSGLGVTGIVGVAGSPSCGAATTLDLGTSLRALASCPYGRVTSEWLNRRVVGGAVRPGQGLFVEALTDELSRRGLEVPAAEFVLAAGAEVSG